MQGDIGEGPAECFLSPMWVNRVHRRTPHKERIEVLASNDARQGKAAIADGKTAIANISDHGDGRHSERIDQQD